MAIGFNVTNAAEFGKVLEVLRKEFTGLSQEGAADWCQATLELAKKKCPTDTGKLASTAKLVVGKTKKTDVHVIKISFGDKKVAPYGAIVHFDPNLTHPNGEVRYLFNAVAEKRKEVPQVIGARIKAKGKSRARPKPQ